MDTALHLLLIQPPEITNDPKRPVHRAVKPYFAMSLDIDRSEYLLRAPSQKLSCKCMSTDNLSTSVPESMRKST